MEITIKPLPPFDFSLSSQIFSEGDGRIQKYEGGIYSQAIRLGERLAHIKVRSLGTTDAPLLSADLQSDRAFSRREVLLAESSIQRIFNLDLNLLPFYAAAKGDRIMGRLTHLLRGLKSPSTATAFEALIDSIIEQQISLKAAWSMQRRLIETFGDALILGDRTLLIFPQAKRLAAAPIEQLRRCGLSGRKAQYVRDVSQRVSAGLDLEAFRAYPDEEIVEELCKIRGVGVWTAEMTMIRGLQKFDAMPADDLGLRRIISHYYYDGKKIGGDEARRTAQDWMPWRGLASFYLIMAERQRIEI